MNKHIDLNNGWEFTETFSEEFLQGGGEGVTSVRLPHTFVETPYDYFDESSYQAVCGYRRTLTVPVEWTAPPITPRCIWTDRCWPPIAAAIPPSE